MQKFSEFIVGRGKIIQGECLEVMRSIPDHAIILAFTSPPYLDAINYEEHIEKLNGQKERWERTKMDYNEYREFLVTRFREL